MSELTKISDVIMHAFELVISRDGDVDTEDGSFATCGTDEIIRLDEAMAHYFKVGSDDVSLCNVDLILRKAKELDANQELITKQAEQLKMLRSALEAVVKVNHTHGGSLGSSGSFYYKVSENVFKLCDKALEATKPVEE